MGRMILSMAIAIILASFGGLTASFPRHFGYILAGYSTTYTNGQEDFLVFKLDMAGQVQWVENLGGTAMDRPLFVQQTADAGYVLCGATRSFGGDHADADLLAYKLNRDGKKQARRTFANTGEDSASAIVQTADGGYVLAGWVESSILGVEDPDFLLMKFNTKGEVVWRRTYGGNNRDYGLAVCELPGGGYLLSGISLSYTNGDSDFLIYRLTEDGHEVWRKNYGGVLSEWIDPQRPSGQSMALMADGHILLCGSSTSFTNGGSDIVVYKLDLDGNKIFRRFFGGGEDEIAASVCPTSDGGFVVAGGTRSYVHGVIGQDWDAMVYKFDPGANIEWSRNLGGSFPDTATSVVQDPLGNLLVAGTTMSQVTGEVGRDKDIILYNLDPTGNVLWEKNFGGAQEDGGGMVNVTEPYFPPSNDRMIDHRCTHLETIHPYWIDRAKAILRCSYGRSSYGLQPLNGMTILSFNPEYENLYLFNMDGNVKPGVLSIADKTPSGDLGYPDCFTWERLTREYLLGEGRDRNVVMWGWCGQVGYSSPEWIDLYLYLMAGLEADFPDVTFVYMTGHLDGSGKDGNLNLRNNQIRDYCRANNKFLYDFADIESFDPGAQVNYMELYADQTCDFVGGNWADQWCKANPEECSACYCAHSRSLNCDLKARAFWWLMARLAGWNGN